MGDTSNKKTNLGKTTAERLKEKTIVYFTKNAEITSEFLEFVGRNHPETKIMVLPIEYGTENMEETLKAKFTDILKTQPVDAVVFDTISCPIDRIMDVTKNSTNPILPHNRNVPVMLYSGVVMNPEKTQYWVTHSANAPVPKSINTILEKPAGLNELLDGIADMIDAAKSRGVA